MIGLRHNTVLQYIKKTESTLLDRFFCFKYLKYLIFKTSEFLKFSPIDQRNETILQFQVISIDFNDRGISLIKTELD